MIQNCCCFGSPYFVIIWLGFGFGPSLCLISCVCSKDCYLMTTVHCCCCCCCCRCRCRCPCRRRRRRRRRCCCCCCCCCLLVVVLSCWPVFPVFVSMVSPNINTYTKKHNFREWGSHWRKAELQWVWFKGFCCPISFKQGVKREPINSWGAIHSNPAKSTDKT